MNSAVNYYSAAARHADAIREARRNPPVAGGSASSSACRSRGRTWPGLAEVRDSVRGRRRPALAGRWRGPSVADEGDERNLHLRRRQPAVLAPEMLLEASGLEPVDGFSRIRQAHNVGEPAAQLGRRLAERAEVDQPLDLHHVRDAL